MNLIIPSEGLMFWTALVFIILLVLLKKFAWKPILGAVHTRENNIQKALDSALEAESRMQSLVSENEKLLAAARDERDIILKEAKAAKEEIVGGAKEQANAEASKILADARQQISIEACNFDTPLYPVSMVGLASMTTTISTFLSSLKVLTYGLLVFARIFQSIKRISSPKL